MGDHEGRAHDGGYIQVIEKLFLVNIKTIFQETQVNNELLERNLSKHCM